MTGREGRLRANLMIQAGAVITAAVTPGRDGERVLDVPVFDTVAAAKRRHPEINASLVVVPPAAARDAALEAIAADIELVRLMPERLPQQDAMEIIAHARARHDRDLARLVIWPDS